MKKFVKEHMVILIVSVVLVLIAIYALFQKYDYEVLHSAMLENGLGGTYGGPYLDGEYVDAVLKIKGSVFKGKIKCYYYNSNNKAEWENIDDLILVERIYEAGDDIEEEIYIGILESKWQCIGIEQIGEESTEQTVEVTLEARQYGYQIVAEFLKLKTPIHS